MKQWVDFAAPVIASMNCNLQWHFIITVLGFQGILSSVWLCSQEMRSSDLMAGDWSTCHGLWKVVYAEQRFTKPTILHRDNEVSKPGERSRFVTVMNMWLLDLWSNRRQGSVKLGILPARLRDEVTINKLKILESVGCSKFNAESANKKTMKGCI